jgi:hypothetical protein
LLTQLLADIHRLPFSLSLYSYRIVNRLVAGASELRDCSESGLQLLAECFSEEVYLCEKWGNSRPEEVSIVIFSLL